MHWLYTIKVGTKVLSNITPTVTRGFGHDSRGLEGLSTHFHGNRSAQGIVSAIFREEYATVAFLGKLFLKILHFGCQVRGVAMYHALAFRPEYGIVMRVSAPLVSYASPPARSI